MHQGNFPKALATGLYSVFTFLFCEQHVVQTAWRPQLETATQHKETVSMSRVQHVLAQIRTSHHMWATISKMDQSIYNNAVKGPGD